MKPKQKKLIKSSAKDSILKLIDQAHKAYEKGQKKRANRYVQMAWELLKKHKVRLPKEYKNSFCRKCRIVWIPGETAIVFFDKKRNALRIECKNCKYKKII